MLPQNNRLKKKKDFERVFKKGKGFKEDFLTLKTAKNDLKFSRFGFVVSQKVSKKATVRNKIKRVLREIIEKNLPLIKKGNDVLIVTLPGLEIKDFWEFKDVCDKLLQRANLIRG